MICLSLNPSCTDISFRVFLATFDDRGYGGYAAIAPPSSCGGSVWECLGPPSDQLYVSRKEEWTVIYGITYFGRMLLCYIFRGVAIKGRDPTRISIQNLCETSEKLKFDGHLSAVFIQDFWMISPDDHQISLQLIQLTPTILGLSLQTPKKEYDDKWW